MWPAGPLSRASLQRHREHHLPTHLVQSKQAQDLSRADRLLAQVEELQERALNILNRAEQSGDNRTALAAIREVRGNVELLSKLTGELKEAQGARAEATAQALVVMVDGKAVEDEMARRAAARALLAKFTRKPPSNAEEGGSPAADLWSD